MKKMVNENLKDELIDKLMKTVFKEDDPKYKDWKDSRYLRSLTISELDDLLSDYYLYDIKRRK